MVTFEGTVDESKKVDLKDSEGKQDGQTFVQIRLADDEERVVSLGSRLVLSDLDIDKGDKISVTGRNSRMDDRDVLIANRIQVDDKLFIVSLAVLTYVSALDEILDVVLGIEGGAQLVDLEFRGGLPTSRLWVTESRGVQTWVQFITHLPWAF